LIGRLKQRPNPYRTIEIYKRLGFTDNDFLIQLDLPPSPHFGPEKRRELIEKSAEFYHIMSHELDVLGVVHGWTMSELKYSLRLLECDKQIGVGTYAATSVIASHAAQAEMVLLRVSRKTIFERLVNVLQLLRDYDVFMLGSSNPNMVHIVFLLGSRYTDGGAWRIAASHGVIYVPGDGRYSIGKKNISKRLKNPNVLREWYLESPFRDVPFTQFYNMLIHDFKARALWNAFALKKEEEIANQFSSDPDRYYRYLLKRFKDNRFWRNVLKFVWTRYCQKYVQSDLEIFLRVKDTGGML